MIKLRSSNAGSFQAAEPPDFFLVPALDLAFANTAATFQNELGLGNLN
jgi:hypothetical protein